MKVEEFKALRKRQEALAEHAYKLLDAYSRNIVEDEDARLLLALLTSCRLSEDLLVACMEEAAELETLRTVQRVKANCKPREAL